MSSQLLIVDDERLIRWSLEQTLAKGGYEVSSASTGEAALAAVREDPPDLILLDLKLPDIDGLQVLRQIKELSPHLQVLIMTAYADVGTAVEAMKLGAYDYLPKPIDFENLAVTIRTTCRSPSTSRTWPSRSATRWRPASSSGKSSFSAKNTSIRSTSTGSWGPAGGSVR